MKLTILAVAIMSSIICSGTLLADDDCIDPVADWKPREVLQQQLEQRGWSIQRIKVDDGCYQVRGVDHRGNKFKAKYAPASLRILKLEIVFSNGGDASDYLDKDHNSK